MQDPFELPAPPADAAAHSARLTQLIAARIAAAGGVIDFADYMDLCLYAPGLGYYSAGATRFGPAGDFVTAPELSPLFALCLARVAEVVLPDAGPGSRILELGAGSGRLAADLLNALAARNLFPAYDVLEVSAALRARQRELIAQVAPERLHQVRWLDGPPDDGFTGLILANEVADALAVRRFRISGREVESLGVAWREGRPVSAPRVADDALRDAVLRLRDDTGAEWPGNYVSEVCPQLPAWIAAITRGMRQGVFLLMDYGLPRREYYHPERRRGTLRCHYRHRVHDDPFLWPGLQDITAWVDFTLVAEAADAAGLAIAGYTTQAHFLLSLGLADALAGLAATGGAEGLAAAAAARRLLLPGEMGETVKVMALSRGIGAIPGFTERDLRHLL